MDTRTFEIGSQEVTLYEHYMEHKALGNTRAIPYKHITFLKKWKNYNEFRLTIMSPVAHGCIEITTSEEGYKVLLEEIYELVLDRISFEGEK